MAIKLVLAEEMSNETQNIEEETKKREEEIKQRDEEIKQRDEEIKHRFEYVIEYFQKTNPNPTTELKHNNEYELLVATILSAQTTDKRVNIVTPALFEKYPTIEKLAKATPEEIYPFINSVNYANNKSGYIVGMAKMVMTRYNGKIPEDTEELQNLPGVGRKTANVVAATLFNKPVLAVDTHVARVSQRIGLVIDPKNPLDIEEQLVRHTPTDVISKMSHWLILHGRYICTAKNPLCKECGINKVCRYYEMNF